MLYSLKRPVVLILALLCFSLSFISCSNEKKGSSEGFTDALGRNISFDSPPTRVAALIGSFADVWTLAGGDLVAAPIDAWEDFGLTLDCAVNIGGAHTPSLEALISSDPDFVIASASTASNLEMRDTLEAMGITVAYFDVDNFDDYLKMLKICTDITGRADLYEQNGLEIKRRIDSIKADITDENFPEGQRRVLLIRASSTSVKAKGSSGTILGEMLEDLGCINIADSDGTLLDNLSIEAIIRENPYRVFVVTMGSDSEAALRSFNSLIAGNPAWTSLDAIEEGRVHVMDKSLFNLKPNDRWAEAYEKLYEILVH